MIYYKAGLASGYFFYMLSLDVVDFNFILFATFRVVGSETCSLLKSSVRQLVTVSFYNDMRTGEGL